MNYKKYFSFGIDTLLTNRMDLAAKYKKQALFSKAAKKAVFFIS